MSNVLVFCECRESRPKKVVFEMLAAAGRLVASTGGSVRAVAIGSGLSNLGETLGAHRASTVYIADGVEEYNSDGYVNLLFGLIEKEKPSVVMFGATALGKEVAPRVAARLGAGVAGNIVDIRMDGDKVICKRPVFAGKAFTEVAFLASPAVVTLRPNVLDVGPGGGEPASEISLDGDMGATRTTVIQVIGAENTAVDLTEADRIVSGGRGVKSAENFAIINELADVLGATVGASRAAVDSGFVDESFQVGQTGKVVNPSLYVACGISGAIQHQAGMKTSKVIVAINKDPKAPIFQIADYGIVADLFEAIPLLTEELKKAAR